MVNNEIGFKELQKKLNLNREERQELYNQIGNRKIDKVEADAIRLQFRPKVIKKQIKVDEISIKKLKITTEIKKEIKKMSKDLNIIYYGPAGTGKTREALKKVEELTVENHNKPLLEKELLELEEQFEEAKGRSATTLGNKIKKLKEDILALDEEKKTFFEFTTFHPSYQYQEFIEGITIREENKKTVYEIKPGIFKKLAQRALENKDKNYVLIIDEINRGNISSIFGEFFTLLEDTKRVSSTDEENSEAVSITLPYSQDKLSVPDNLYIIGTMNTTDKSISLLDVALRRRFKFIAVEPDYSVLETIDILDTAKMLQSINERLAVLKGEDFQIGHSYFLNATTLEDLKEIFEFKIIPLLKEYFHGDWESICAILNQDFKNISNEGLLINKFTINSNIFKDNSRFSDIAKKKKVLTLNSSFQLKDLKTII